MVYLYWGFVIFFLLPALTGQIGRTLEQQHLTPNFARRFPARVKALGEPVLLAYTIIFCLALLLLATGHRMSGGDAPFSLRIIAPLTMYFLTARLFYLRYKLQIHKYSSTRPAKLLFTLLVFFAVWLSNVYTDYLFLTYTRIAPSDLPAAKTGVLAIVAAVVWVALISMLTIIPYIFMAVVVGVMKPRPTDDAEMCMSPAKRVSIPRWHNFISFSLFLGLAFGSTSPLYLLDYASKNPSFEPFVRRVITFASFHLKDSQCTNNQPEGSRFAPLGYERLAVAIPDEGKGYLFKTLKCPNGDAAKAPEKKPQVSVPLEFDQQEI